MARHSKRQIKNKRDKKRRINHKQRNLSNEITKFYISELVVAKTKNLEESLAREDKELRIIDQIILASIKRRAAEQIIQISGWIREYLVYAIDSELDNQGQLRKKEYVELIDFTCPDESKDTERQDLFLMYASERQIIDYLNKAVFRFEQRGWSVGFGGNKWAEIARIAKELWRSRSVSDMCIWVDRSFQAQHNGGMIFDKRSDLIISNEDFDTKTLDIKRNCTDIDHLATKLNKRSNDKETKWIIRKLTTMLKKIERCKKRNALGGDKSIQRGGNVSFFI